ncbi:DUF3515 family protein [Micromonospora sp. WMMD882]|uniref:DUF3515 family protein n=1 Tax=Micromonospora sp. WMMD882 TaxID=3015151 RepID=UPI00248C25A0|nr:DUF3515 family protein [Micromonospora sp. WMMD882]WBB81980.1 DUF3515 family protein [Micromonospora sp. WMMD882]
MDSEKTSHTDPGATPPGSAAPPPDDATGTPDDAATTPGDARTVRPKRRGWDRSTRNAALVAALVAVPVTVAVAGVTFAALAPEGPADPDPGPSVTAVRPQATTAVEMAAAPLAERPATVCRALLSQLPPAVRELTQRPVTAGAEQNAAYGDPALTVACGVPEPTVPAADTVWVAGKVCWYVREEAAATVLTSVDRETGVQVTVPRAYEQPLQWITPVADAVVASVPSADPVPTGCRS